MFQPDYQPGSQEQTVVIYRYMDLNYKERRLAYSHDVLGQRVTAIEYPSLSIINVKTPISKEEPREKVNSRYFPNIPEEEEIPKMTIEEYIKEVQKLFKIEEEDEPLVA